MGFRVTVYCHDRNELVFEQEFATWRAAHNCAMEKTKHMHINTSVGVDDFNLTEMIDKVMAAMDAVIDAEDDDTPVAPV